MTVIEIVIPLSHKLLYSLEAGNLFSLSCCKIILSSLCSLCSSNVARINGISKLTDILLVVDMSETVMWDVVLYLAVSECCTVFLHKTHCYMS